MSRSAASPRIFQPYSPRRPSPLGLPPFTPRGTLQDIPCSAYPKTPERYYLQHYSAGEPTPSHGMRFPPDVHRRNARSTRRAKASPPAPLSLDSQYHPAADVVHLPSIEESIPSQATQEMRAPPSPTLSSTSSLSLYSAESAKKSLEIGEEGKENKKGGGFCLCFSAFLYSISLTAYRYFILYKTSQRSSVLNPIRTRFSLLKHKYKCLQSLHQLHKWYNPVVDQHLSCWFNDEKLNITGCVWNEMVGFRCT